MSRLQMTANTLNALKGWPHMHAVDFSAEFDPGIPSDDLPVLPGTVVSLNPSGKYILGVGNSNVMPMFIFPASDDADVANYGGNASTDRGVWVSVGPTGQAVSLVAIGAYELVSTAFVSGSYPPNTPLTANKSGGSDPGKLRTGVINTNMIVGLVSRGVVDNGYGHNALAFWPCPIFVQ